jgi:2-oxo-4-hydroxy-4-carboxy--5-ureidoimidazoline (OHCU) decarboxylase
VSDFSRGINVVLIVARANTPSVFVNGRPRPTIMENMRTRIDRGDIKTERQEAIQAMCDIATDRASKLQT